MDSVLSYGQLLAGVLIVAATALLLWSARPANGAPPAWAESWGVTISLAAVLGLVFGGALILTWLLA